jgi:DNA mismatch endonuclease, patch repair protein
MADVLTREQRSFNMSRITGKNTKPELILRRFLFSKGLRGYRVHSALFGKPDIVFPRHKLVIFVDGCFWHKCPRCFVKPATNRGFWEKKIAGNIKRDQLVKKRLSEDGYKVIRFWEHEIRKNINKCYFLIAREFSKRDLPKRQ